MPPHQPNSTPFPYTTLFRSEPGLRNYRPRLLGDEQGHNFWVVDGQTSYKRPTIKGAGAPGTAAPPGKALQSARRASPRSEEHTSELQSLRHLVCRLLLEKKK